MRRLRAAATASVALLMAGCAARAPRVPPLEPGAAGGAELANRLAAAVCPPNLASDLDLKIQPPGRSAIQLYGKLRAQWPDRLRLQARFGPFTPVLSVAVAGDSAFVILPRANAYWSGRPGGDRVNPAAFAAGILRVICPGPLIRSIHEPILDRGRDGWVLRGRMGAPEGSPLLLEVGLPPEQDRVREIRILDPDGRVELRAEREGEEDVGAATVPGRLHIEVGQPPLVVDARLLRPGGDPNPPPDTFHLAPAPGLRVLDEEDLLDLLYGNGLGP